MRILMIEDDPVLGDLISELLTDEGQTVHWSRTASAGFSEIVNSPYDVVLLDLQLGRGRGEFVISRARAAGALLPPIVIFTAQPVAEVMEASRSLAPAAIVRKPCTIDELLGALVVANGTKPNRPQGV